MHDIKLIREKPEWFDAQLARRGLTGGAKIRADDLYLRALKTKSESDKATLNVLSGSIGRALKDGDQPEANLLKAEVAHLKSLVSAKEAEQNQIETQVSENLGTLPNLPADDVPDGMDEADNVVVHERGGRHSFNFPPREHSDFGTALGLDFESAQSISGARFAYLRKGVARLARALGQFMLDVHTTEFGYEEVAPPLLVRDSAMFGTGQLPKFEEDSFKTDEETRRWLIPTAEVSLTNLVRERILADADLPLRFTALTPCFRSEAGAAGRDTRGLIRQHQFDKVELVSITPPDYECEWTDKETRETYLISEHERMTRAAETILDRLAVPYRRMLLCASDMGFSARKTYDLEVWLPGQGRYREISSCSDCGDFQARRMKTRYRPVRMQPVVGFGSKPVTHQPQYVHTLNGSGVAVGRALVAVMENYQQENGAVVIPEALLPYMGGITRLDP